MALSDAQIERYSRQIIVPEIGGRGQERLLAARLMIAGEPGDIEPVLAYMVGAGVGTIKVRIDIESAKSDRSRLERVVADMRSLNRDAEVVLAKDGSDPADLVLVLAGSAESVNLAQTLSRAPGSPALIVARLDAPGKIAVMAKAPPCPACADADLLAPFAARAETAGFVAMAAAVEAFKLLAAPMGCASMVLEFDGYQCTAREIKAQPRARCGCTTESEPR